MTNVQRVVSWNTKKTAAGFEFRVYSFDYQVADVEHARGTLPTRAQAVARAKQWVRYIKAQQ